MIGFGLPTLALAVLTATLALRPAMALMLLASVVINARQGHLGNAISIADDAFGR